MFKNEGIEIDNKIDEESIHRLGSHSKELEDSIDHQDFNRDLYKSAISEENTDKINDVSIDKKSKNDKKKDVSKNNKNENINPKINQHENEIKNITNTKEIKDNMDSKISKKSKNENKVVTEQNQTKSSNDNNSKKINIKEKSNEKQKLFNNEVRKKDEKPKENEKKMQNDIEKEKSKSKQNIKNFNTKEMSFKTVFKPDSKLFSREIKIQEGKLASNKGLLYKLNSNTDHIKIGSKKKKFTKSNKISSQKKGTTTYSEERKETSNSKSNFFNKTGEIPSFKQKINFKNNERYSLYLNKPIKPVKVKNQTFYETDNKRLNQSKTSNKSKNIHDNNFQPKLNMSDERFFKKQFEPFYNYNSVSSYTKPLNPKQMKQTYQNSENKSSSKEKQEYKITETDYINDFNNTNNKHYKNKFVFTKKDKMDKIKNLLYNSKNPYSVCWVENNLIEKYNCKISFANFIGGYPVFKLVKNDKDKISKSKPVRYN